MAVVVRYFNQIFSYRELILNLAIKDFKVRYKSATLGFLWMLLNPVLQMIVLSVVFSLIVRFENLGAPYPLFLLCGLIPWNFLSMSVSAGSHSLVEESNLVNKVYFPREIIPISTVLGHFINFITALILFFPIPLFICKSLSWSLLFLPIPIILLLMFTLALTSLVANLDVFYRDTRYIVDALILVWFYATPIFYPIHVIYSVSPTLAGKLGPIFLMNPMLGFIEMFRSILLLGQFPEPMHLLLATGWIGVLGAIAIWLYHKRGPVMADYL